MDIFIPSSAHSPVRWKWITLTGPDARDFLQRLTTVHVNGLSQGQGSPGCFLNSQGKIQSYFTLWHYHSQEYAFEFEAGISEEWMESLLSWMDKYTFAEKITVYNPTPELSCYWLFPKSEDSLPSELRSLRAGSTFASDEEIRFCHQGSLTYGRAWITAWGRPARLEQWIHRQRETREISFTQLESARIQALRPRIDFEITHDVLPLEIGLLEAVAKNKGCYPGQEVIEKIAALGSPAKRLVQIQGTGSPPLAGDIITQIGDSPIELGRVTSVDEQPTTFLALANIRKIYAKEGLTVFLGAQRSTQGGIVKVAPYAD